MKIKKGDKVIVIAGKNKGKTGIVTETNRKKNTLIVEKINLQTKHIKKGQQGPGQKIEKESPIDSSNTMLLDPKTNERTRIGYRILKDGKKERYAKKSGETLQ